MTLSCKFRSYPIPLSTSWSDTQGVLTEESKDFDEWTRTLYLLRATEPRTFTCFGSREDYDGINETEKHEFMIEVRGKKIVAFCADECHEYVVASYCRPISLMVCCS